MGHVRRFPGLFVIAALSLAISAKGSSGRRWMGGGYGGGGIPRTAHIGATRWVVRVIENQAMWATAEAVRQQIVLQPASSASEGCSCGRQQLSNCVPTLSPHGVGAER